MKKYASLALRFTLGFNLVVLNGCGKKDEQPSTPVSGQPPAASASATAPKAPAPVSAEKNSFQEVTSKLDAGGNLYLYFGTEQWLDGLSTKVASWRSLISSIPDLKSEDREKAAKIFDVATNLIKESGLEDVSGVGMSSIA